MSASKENEAEGRLSRQKASGQKASAINCRRKFLRFFPGGFRDETYINWERGYKWEAHEEWEEALSREEFRRLIGKGDFTEIAGRAVRVEQRVRYSMLFSFEKMALRDAVKTLDGARTFAQGLYDYLHGKGSLESRFNSWVEAVGALPRRQTRVLTWPMVTVWGFLAAPSTHIFLKPMVTRRAAEEYRFDFQYKSRPSWETYSSLLQFAETIRRDLKDLKPRDYIDIQSFIWVQGSDEYEE